MMNIKPSTPESGFCWCGYPAGPAGLCEHHEFQRLAMFGNRTRAHLLDALFGVRSRFTTPGPEIDGDGTDGPG